MSKDFNKTKDGLTIKILGNQRSTSKLRGHKPPNYTLEELRAWLYSQELFHRLFNLWSNSNYDILLIPSVDRKDDKLGYSFGNIQLMTWNENNIRGHKTKQNKTVIQLTKQGDFVAEYCSIVMAAKQTKINKTNIGFVCRKERKSAGGYYWHFKKSNVN